MSVPPLTRLATLARVRKGQIVPSSKYCALQRRGAGKRAIAAGLVPAGDGLVVPAGDGLFDPDFSQTWRLAPEAGP